MKKLLLTLGFLPVIVFATIAEKPSPKQALIEELTKLMNDSKKENFTEELYLKQLDFYNFRYQQSHKNPLCYETTEALKNGLKFHYSLNYHKIKTLIITPHVNKLSNKQIKNLLTELRKNNNDASRDTENLMNAFIETINKKSVYKGKIYTEKDIQENCPVLN